MEPIFCGSCDLCKLDKKFLTILQKPTANALNLAFGLKISNPAMWRICAKCSYEVGHILMTFLKKITNNKHHPAMSPDLSKCNICGCKNIIKGFKMTKSIMEIRDTGLAVPLSGSGESFACLECIHLTDVVIEYKKMLTSSQIWLTSVRPFQNLTETINAAKRSTSKKKKRNSQTLKETPKQSTSGLKETPKSGMFSLSSLPKLPSSVVQVKRLDFSSPNAISDVDEIKKPVKLRQGATWDDSGLTNGFLRRSSTDQGYMTDSDVLCSRNRGQRKRKRTKNDDFIYFSEMEFTPNVFSARLKVNGQKKSPPKLRTLPKQTKTKNPLPVTKPCRVVLNRIQVMPLNKTPELVREENVVATDVDETLVDPLSNDEEIFRGFVNNNKRHANDRQNENCPPNIPDLDILMPSDNSSDIPDLAAKPPKIVTNGFETKPVFHELSSSSSSSTLSVDESTLKSSLLTTSKSANKSVSFSDFDQVYYYTDEDATQFSSATDISNEIEIDDLNDDRNDDSLEFLEEHKDEIEKVIDEIISQQYE